MENDKKIIKKKINVHRTLFILSILIVPAVMFAFFYVYVNANSFLLSFQEVSGFSEYKFVGFKNYIEFFKSFTQSGQAGRSLLNSVKMWWISFSITIPLYLIVSYYIVKKMPGHRVVYFLVLIPQVVSTFLYALVYQKLVDFALQDVMEALGFPNFPNLITDPNTAMFNNLFFTIWLSFGTSTLIFVNAMNAVDPEMMESAKIDGVNDRQEFFSIVLPNIWPTLTTYVVTGVTSMFTWSGSLMTFYMYGAPEHIWGLEYYFSKMVAEDPAASFANYPKVAVSGMVVMLFSLPLVFGVRAIMNRLDRTEQ